MTQSSFQQRRDANAPLSPATLSVHVPRADGRREQRGSIILATYSKASYADLKIRKREKDDPEYANNLADQQERIARAMFNLARAEPRRPMAIMLDCPDEIGRKGSESYDQFVALLKREFEQHRPGIQMGPRYANMTEAIGIMHKHVRERGNWAELMQDMQVYIISFSNGEYSVTTLMVVTPRQISWKSDASDTASPVEASLTTLYDLLPNVPVAHQVGIWTNSTTINSMIRGHAVKTTKNIGALGQLIKMEREKRGVDIAVIAAEDHSLMRLGVNFATRALMGVSQGDILTPQMRAEKEQKEALRAARLGAAQAAQE